MTEKPSNKRQGYYLPKLEEAIQMGYEGRCEAITLHFKDRQIRSMDIIKEEETKRKLVDLLREDPYQNIEVKSHNGRISRIKRTIKVWLGVTQKNGNMRDSSATQDSRGDALSFTPNEKQA